MKNTKEKKNGWAEKSKAVDNKQGKWARKFAIVNDVQRPSIWELRSPAYKALQSVVEKKQIVADLKNLVLFSAFFTFYKLTCTYLQDFL